MSQPLPVGPLVTDADPDDDFPRDLADAVRIELVNLWCDLGTARRNANNGSWSMGCSNIAYRIVLLSRLVGATPWGDVDAKVLLDGLYTRLYDEAGIGYPPVDWDRVREVQARIGTG